MKKILSVAVAAFMLVGSIFAIDFSVDGNFAIPLDFAKTETKSENTVLGVKTTYNRTTNYQEVGFGGDVGIKAMLTKNFGLKLDLGLYFPNSQSWKTTTVTTVNNSSSTTNSILTENMFIQIFMILTHHLIYLLDQQSVFQIKNLMQFV